MITLCKRFYINILAKYLLNIANNCTIMMSQGYQKGGIIIYIKYDINHTYQDLTSIHFSVLSVNVISYDINWHSTMHHHNFAEIFYCLEGEGYLMTDYGQHPVKKNSLIVVNPYTEHTEHTSIEKPLKYIVIGIRGPEIMLPAVAFDNALYCIEDSDHHYFPMIKQIMEEVEKNSRYSSLVIDYLVNIILLQLNNRSNTMLSIQDSRPMSTSVRLAKNYIDYNYSKNITLKDLEEKAHVSKFHLSHLFKEEIGLSPINYLIQVRFYHAKTLLETTNFSILQISQLVGFNSVNSFSTIFKKHFNCTPKDYRHKNRTGL